VDINARNKNGEHPLNVATNYDNLEAMRLLLDAGVDPNLMNMGKLTPLQVLAARGTSVETFNIAAAKMLIAKGASVTVANKDGQTPLFLATRANSINMVKLLVESGANVNAESFEIYGGTGPYGLTPTLLAEDLGYPEISAYLRSKGGKVNYSYVAKRAAYRTGKGAVEVIIAPFYYGH